MSAGAPVPLGRFYTSAGAREALARYPHLAVRLLEWLNAHARGECPEMPPNDQQANAEAVAGGLPVCTRWRTGIADRPWLWIETEADRSRTTLRLPE